MDTRWNGDKGVETGGQEYGEEKGERRERRDGVRRRVYTGWKAILHTVCVSGSYLSSTAIWMSPYGGVVAYRLEWGGNDEGWNACFYMSRSWQIHRNKNFMGSKASKARESDYTRNGDGGRHGGNGGIGGCVEAKLHLCRIHSRQER